jgi:hypothetical protein
MNTTIKKTRISFTLVEKYGNGRATYLLVIPEEMLSNFINLLNELANKLNIRLVEVKSETLFKLFTLEKPLVTLPQFTTPVAFIPISKKDDELHINIMITGYIRPEYNDIIVSKIKEFVESLAEVGNNK